MKISDLIEARGQGVEHWTVHNMSGVAKKFKKIDGFWEHPVEVKNWMKSHGDPKYNAQMEREARKREREYEKADREEAKRNKPPKVDLDLVWQKFQTVVGDSFPDGDPIDGMTPWFKKTYNLEYDWGKYLDQAAAKHGFKNGYTDYLATFHDEYSPTEEPRLNLHSLHSEPKKLVDKKPPAPPKKRNPWRTE